jgi:hypothetical protein
MSYKLNVSISRLNHFYPISGLMFMQSNLHITVTSLVAAAVVWMSEFPARLNPIILPLMASIKREQVATKI